MTVAIYRNGWLRVALGINGVLAVVMLAWGPIGPEATVTETLVLAACVLTLPASIVPAAGLLTLEGAGLLRPETPLRSLCWIVLALGSAALYAVLLRGVRRASKGSAVS